MNNTGIIILAAGSSSRFGNTKQLLHFKGKTLLKHTIEEAAEAGAQPVVVVTGANADEISREIKNEKVEIVFNKNWEQGMASGIVIGLKKAITSNKELESVIITVCDQPFVSSSLFQQLFQKQNESVKHIVASAYADTIGTPALFTIKYFDALMGLTGDQGAKGLLKKYSEDLATVDFPEGYIDIDTQEDYENLLKRNPGP
jgi:molybdenum cofactor cytidylyltransferase